MARSLSKSRRSWPVPLRFVAMALVASIVLYDGTAYAINAIVSQDLPILVQMAATEMASHTELVAILSEAAATTAQIKEYTDIAKTTWGALSELRQMSFVDLTDAVRMGVGNAFPELGTIYGDIGDIRDLDRRDPQALLSLRGMLWEEVYGPAIDYLHSGHANLEATAAMAEHRGRQARLLAVRRQEAERWEEDCKETSARDGSEGACQAAANRAAVQNAIALQNLHETALLQLQAQERLIQNQDREELDKIYGFERILYDARNYLFYLSGAEECVAGQCVYERYSQAMWTRIEQYRMRHPARGPMILRRGDEVDGDAP